MNPFASIPFPGQAISPNSPQSTRLKSGEILLFPEGNYLVRPGAQSAVQWKDSYSGLWRIVDAASTNAPIYVGSDGTNYRAINLSGTIQGINVTTAGTGYTQANTTATFAAPVTGGITAQGTPIVGGALSLAVTTAGSGYTNPILLIPAPNALGGTPGLCIPAAAILSTTTGAIASATFSFAGAGYPVVPGPATQTITPAQFQANPSYYLNQTNMVIIDPTGTGAVLTASIANGTAASGGITGIIMTDTGSLYDGTHIPAVTITSATGSSGAATALPWMALTGVTVGSTNTGYTASVVGITSLTSSAAALQQLIAGEPVLIRAGRFIADQSGGVLGTPVIEDAGGGFQTVPLAKQVGNATADGSVNATFVAVVGGVNNSLIFWQL